MKLETLARWGVLLLPAALGCGTSSDQAGATAAPPAATRQVKKAIAWINPKSDSTVAGSAIFISEGGVITLQVNLEQTPPGEHALHIHEVGNCDSPDGSSAGDHFNPTAEAHGQWGVSPHHLGDIGNVLVGEDGKGSLTLATDLWSMGTGASNDILERSVIVHASADDMKTQPTGAAGGRIGCGVIRIPQ